MIFESYTADTDFTIYVNFKLTIKLHPIINVISQITYAWKHKQNNKPQTINYSHKNTGSVHGDKNPNQGKTLRSL